MMKPALKYKRIYKSIPHQIIAGVLHYSEIYYEYKQILDGMSILIQIHKPGRAAKTWNGFCSIERHEYHYASLPKINISTQSHETAKQAMLSLERSIKEYIESQALSFNMLKTLFIKQNKTINKIRELDLE